MYRFSRSIGSRIYLLFLFIGVIVLLAAGIFVFFKGNTILAQEIKYTEQAQEANQATAFILETRQEGQDEAYIHILAFSIVILISGSAAGILIIIKRRVKAAKKME